MGLGFAMNSGCDKQDRLDICFLCANPCIQRLFHIFWSILSPKRMTPMHIWDLLKYDAILKTIISS
jgi:hypothetical protein